MKPTISSFSRYFRIIFVFFLLLTIADAFFSFQNLNTVHDNERQVDNAYEVKIELQGLLVQLVNAETGQRGYLLTGNTGFLQPYKTALPQISQTINHIDQITTASSVKEQIPTLRRLVNQRTTLLNNGLIENQYGDLSTQDLMVHQNKGKAVMDKIRAIIDSMTANEDLVLAQRHVATANSYKTIFTSVGLAMIFDLVLIFLAYYLVRREIERRDEFEKRKDDFISIVAHELKTPITSLRLFSGVLEKRIKDKEALKYVDRINFQAGRLTELIKDLLDMTRIETGKLAMEFSDVDLNQLVKNTVEAVEETSPRHKIVIKGKVEKGVYADRYRLYQVLINLLTNAIKYSPKGGSILVTVAQKRNAAQVSVKDKGIGIAKEHMNKIFDKLYQVNDPRASRHAGLGIGLYIVAQIIRQQRGKIWVESKVGKGTKFIFTVPLITESSSRKRR